MTKDDELPEPLNRPTQSKGPDETNPRVQPSLSKDDELPEPLNRPTQSKGPDETNPRVVPSLSKDDELPEPLNRPTQSKGPDETNPRYYPSPPKKDERSADPGPGDGSSGPERTKPSPSGRGSSRRGLGRRRLGGLGVAAAGVAIAAASGLGWWRFADHDAKSAKKQAAATHTTATTEDTADKTTATDAKELYPEGYDPANAPPGTHPCGPWIISPPSKGATWTEAFCWRLPVSESERKAATGPPWLGYGCVATIGHPYLGNYKFCVLIWPEPGIPAAEAPKPPAQDPSKPTSPS